MEKKRSDEMEVAKKKNEKREKKEECIKKRFKY
ncbi:MAG: hypothetical protein US35_C0033G0007 [Parcubacteria group bacterium GW2011_GWA2_37_10]|nr:MAG: hypothetical protein US35_C0033G0007 [Parcubacteria group bacterium GW2011_GWA2_37_10]